MLNVHVNVPKRASLVSRVFPDPPVSSQARANAETEDPQENPDRTEDPVTEVSLDPQDPLDSWVLMYVKADVNFRMHVYVVTSYQNMCPLLCMLDVVINHIQYYEHISNLIHISHI